MSVILLLPQFFDVIPHVEAIQALRGALPVSQQVLESDWMSARSREGSVKEYYYYNNLLKNNFSELEQI